MTTAEQVVMLIGMTQDCDDKPTTANALAFLMAAKYRILNRMYPFGIPDGVDTVPDRYAALQVEIAAFLYNKRGMEGETSHAENGVSRVYSGADVPEALMRQITPKGMVR